MGHRSTLGHDDKQRLSVKNDLSISQNGVVMSAGRADIIAARNVPSRKNGDDSRRPANRLQIKGCDPRMRLRRHRCDDVQRSDRLRHVVDIDGRSARVLSRAVMRDRLMHGPAHRPPPGPGPWSRSPAAEPDSRVGVPGLAVSIQARRSRFPATVIR